MLQETYQELQKRSQLFKQLPVVVNYLQPKVLILDKNFYNIKSLYLDLVKKYNF